MRRGIGWWPGEDARVTQPVKPSHPVDHSAFTGYRFPPEVIMLAVRWYLPYGLSYRDLEKLLA